MGFVPNISVSHGFIPSYTFVLGFAEDCTLSLKKVEKTTFICQTTW